MKKLITFIILSLVSTLTHASAEEELKRLSKCYGLFVRERIPATDPLWKQVASGQKSGTDACMEIFDKAKLDKNGEIAKGSDGQYDYEGMRVLNTFMRFHKSQFEISDYTPVIGGGIDRLTRDVIDSNEPAYHFVYSLFAPGVKFSEVLTRNHSLRAKRYSQKSKPARSVSGTLVPIYQGVLKTVKDERGVNITIPNEEKGGVSQFMPTFVDTGILIGLERDDADNRLDQDHFDANYLSSKLTSTNVTQHLGAGAIGTQAYLLGNLGKNGFVTGGTNLYRRWGKHVLSDMLCRDLPALRSKDVISEVNPESKIAYRTGISCMGCHSSMDPLAGAVRHQRAVFSVNAGVGPYFRLKFIAERTPDLPFAEFPSENADANFYRRPAWARLYYRSYDGSLVKEEVEGMEELGQKITETNDYYVCAAKRYYRFLTGIEANLADVGDINTPVFSVGENMQRERVIRWGMELKEHQSLRTLVKKIIESNAFIYPDRGV